MISNTRLMPILAIFSILFLSGCTGMIYTKDIKAQNDLISADMASAQKLLIFEEQQQLASFAPNYQRLSSEIGTACDNLTRIDRDGNYWSSESKNVCSNKNGLDKCFFQVETIKAQIKNGDADINLDSLDVLCGDLRSLDMQSNLDGFKSKYKSYASWLVAEKDISNKWGNLTAFFSNTSSGPQLSGAKMSDYYREFKDSISKSKSILTDIKGDCAKKNDFAATSAIAGKVCLKVDGYLADLTRADSIAVDTFNFFGQFETGKMTIDDSFVNNCYHVSDEYSELYNLSIMKDTASASTGINETSTVCQGIENLSNLYARLGISLVFENGDLSSATKNEIFKAKTVYIETDTALGSGVVFDSDKNGYYILTNAHVALDYDTYTGSKYMPNYLRVKFHDGKVSYATKLAYDQEGYDFVILYVPSSGNYPTASYDPTYTPSAGDKVVAVGNPRGLQFSVTQGVVSAIRDMGCLQDYCYGEVIQTDTAINAGNSGGGLWDYDSSNLIGINSLGLTSAEGLNFAISMYQYDNIKDTFKWYNVD